MVLTLHDRKKKEKRINIFKSPHGAPLLFRRFSAHERPQFLGRASSALRSEFVPFQFIRKGKQQRWSEISDSSFVFFVFGEPYPSVFAKHEEKEAGVRNFGVANPTSPSHTSPLPSFVFGEHGGTRLVEHKGTKQGSLRR